MNTEQPHPPALAVWFLRRLCPKRHREVITGDLLERFREGHSDGWFWRQVLVAILVGASSGLRLHWTEIGLAVAGTALTWCIPWRAIFPIEGMITSMNWGARLQWLVLIEIVTALMVLPLFVVLFRVRRTFGWVNLLRVFFTCAMLFTAGDLPTIWWNLHHPVISPSQAAWAIPVMVGWIFATLLISGRVARRLPSPSKTIRVSDVPVWPQ
jgi:hypothetical protein